MKHGRLSNTTGIPQNEKRNYVHPTPKKNPGSAPEEFVFLGSQRNLIDIVRMISKLLE